MRRDGVPVLGFTWYSLTDQMDWDTELAEKNGRVFACGLYDLDRKPRPVAADFRAMVQEIRPDRPDAAWRDAGPDGPAGGAEGGGMTVWVCLHYFGGSAQSWAPLTEVLQEPCVTPDLRGFGSEPPAGAMRVADHADDMAAVLPPDFVLVGHSMGGKVAMAVAARHPTGLRGLVLVAPSPPGPEPMSEDARAKLRAAWGDRAAAAEVARTISRHRDGPAFDRIVADHLRASRAGWDAWLDVGSREDLRAMAGQVNVPVLVVAGADDASLGPDVQARETLPLLPGATMRTVAESQHTVPLDAPHALAQVMMAWAAGL